ncbi:MAG: EamA family transporter [Acidobacteria bacterium]|nr:EamA family transporter [Acidobacteriota bacterium]
MPSVCGPAYITIPIVSMYPVVTIVLAATLLRERAGKPAVLGVLLALGAIILLSIQEPGNTPVHG